MYRATDEEEMSCSVSHNVNRFEQKGKRRDVKGVI